MILFRWETIDGEISWLEKPFYSISRGKIGYPCLCVEVINWSTSYHSEIPSLTFGGILTGKCGANYRDFSHT